MTTMPAASDWTVLLTGGQTGGRFAVVEARVKRGAAPPRHLHSREDELVCVLEGRVTFDRDGERRVLGPGAWLCLPRGCEHAFAVESARARLLVIFAPAGLEEGLRELQFPAARDGPPQIERLVATAARYGVAITGPGCRPAARPIRHARINDERTDR